MGVTVIVPAYNHEAYVQDTIRGLIAQTHPKLDLIVIDDGSTDDTFRRVQQLESECRTRFQHFDFRRTSNQGVGATVNLAASLARFDYLFLFASDDVPLPHAVSTLLPMMLEDEQIGVICGEAEFIDERGSRIQREINGSRHSEFVRYFATNKTNFDISSDFGTYASLLDWNYIPGGPLVRKRILLAAGGYNPRHIASDWDLWLRLSRLCKIRFVDTVCTQYRVHGSNTVSTQRLALWEDAVAIILEQAEVCAGTEHFQRWRQFMQIVCEQAFAEHRKEIDRLSQLAHSYRASRSYRLGRLISRCLRFPVEALMKLWLAFPARQDKSH